MSSRATDRAFQMLLPAFFGVVVGGAARSAGHDVFSIVALGLLVVLLGLVLWFVRQRERGR